MTAIVHRTPGLIDIRAFTTMGMSAKIGDNPIGMFGTGLKYAIAVLVRAGARPVVWIGRDRYEFFCEATQFRDKEFQLVRMKRKRWSLTKPTTHDLPFTTEYGRNWKMWMAYRELDANTRDEKGETYLREGLPRPADADFGMEGHTTIVIEHPEYVQAWEERDEIFLPGAATVRAGNEGLQIIQEPSKRVYYRGMRAYDLNKETLFTYNILAPIELTEDRTLRSEYQIREQIARHILACDDPELIEQVMTVDDDHWEHELPFPEWVQPSQAFRSVVEARPKGLWTGATRYYTRHDRRPVVKVEELLDNHPRPWKVADETVKDANGVTVFDRPYNYDGRWEPLAEELIKRLGFAEEVETAEVIPADEGLDEVEIPF